MLCYSHFVIFVCLNLLFEFSFKMRKSPTKSIFVFENLVEVRRVSYKVHITREVIQLLT